MNNTLIHRIFRRVRRVLGRHPSRPASPSNAPDFSARGLLEADKWLLSDFLLRIIPIVGCHPYPMDELLLMAAAFQYHRPTLVIDIGTHVGKSARIWWELSRFHQLPTGVHTIDLCDPAHPECPGERLGQYIAGTPVVQHIADGYTCAQELITQQPEERFLLFLDGDHAFDSVRKELELAHMIGHGGVLVHDTFYQPESDYNHGPYLAIEDFTKSHPCRQVIHLQTGLPGMSYLRM